MIRRPPRIADVETGRPEEFAGTLKRACKKRSCLAIAVAVTVGMTGAYYVLAKIGAYVFGLFVSGAFDYNVSGKVMVVYPMHDLPWFNFMLKVLNGGCETKSYHSCPGIFRQGMVSDMMGVIGAMYYAEKHGAAGIRLHMDTVDYIDASRGPNYWDYFFASDTYLINPPHTGDKYQEDASAEANPLQRLKGVPEVHFNGYLARFGAFGSWTQVSIGHRSKQVPFPLDNVDCGAKCGISFFEMGQIARKYMRLRPDIMAQVDEIWNSIPADSFVVGAHYRGTDKKLIWPYATPTYSKFADEIENAAKKAGQPADKLHVFLATDEAEVVDYFVRRFGRGKVTFLKSAPRLSSKDGFATEEGTHKSPNFTSYQKGLTAILDIWLLSKCNYVVKGRSSLSDLSLLLGDLEYTHSFYLSDSLIYTKTPEHGYTSHALN